jgi:alpha/beta superfamily hydrolase
VLVICHGHPGNEKNLDIAQAARRAGWVAVTFNYRGSWGSPGNFRFAGTLEDAAAVLAYVREAEHAQKLRADASRIVLAGHSMGGWIAGMIGERDPQLSGVILISAADYGAGAQMPWPALVADMRDNMETLAGVTPELLAQEVVDNRNAFSLVRSVGALRNTPLLVLTADDGLAPRAQALVDAIHTAGGTHVTAVHVATDHGWSDRRIDLQSRILRWLGSLPPSSGH